MQRFEIIDTDDYFGPPLATLTAANYIDALRTFARACGYTSYTAFHLAHPDVRLTVATIG